MYYVNVMRLLFLLATYYNVLTMLLTNYSLRYSTIIKMNKG